MKKLLGILGTITIAGSGTAGLVGNAPAPAKNEVNYLQTNNLKRVKRDVFTWIEGAAKDTANWVSGAFNDTLKGIKTAGRTFVEIDRDVRQAVQNKAIELLNNGEYGNEGKIAAPAAQKVKELWDSYDAWKLKMLS